MACATWCELTYPIPPSITDFPTILCGSPTELPCHLTELPPYRATPLASHSQLSWLNSLVMESLLPLAKPGTPLDSSLIFIHTVLMLTLKQVIG